MLKGGHKLISKLTVKLQLSSQCDFGKIVSSSMEKNRESRKISTQILSSDL